jgi:hypothetical protein
MRERRGLLRAVTAGGDREFDQLFGPTRRSDAIRVGVVDENAG